MFFLKFAREGRKIAIRICGGVLDVPSLYRLSARFIFFPLAVVLSLSNPRFISSCFSVHYSVLPTTGSSSPASLTQNRTLFAYVFLPVRSVLEWIEYAPIVVDTHQRTYETRFLHGFHIGVVVGQLSIGILYHAQGLGFVSRQVGQEVGVVEMHSVQINWVIPGVAARKRSEVLCIFFASFYHYYYYD